MAKLITKSFVIMLPTLVRETRDDRRENCFAKSDNNKNTNFSLPKIQNIKNVLVLNDTGKICIISEIQLLRFVPC